MILKILVTETFLNHIPRGKETVVLKKMVQFVSDYVQANFSMPAMRYGVSVREIKHNRHGLRIFKFRVSKEDRILFTFDLQRIRPDFRKSILFLDYCQHDEQILRGRSINIGNQKIEPFLEDESAFDEMIDLIYENFEYDPNWIVTRVVDVKTMGQLLDSRDNKVIYYLNDEQFACLQIQDVPLFIFGSAGCGKTTINIYKVFLLVMQPIRVAYFTYSNYLVEDAQKLFRKIVEESPNHTFEELENRVKFYHFINYLADEANHHQMVHYEQFHKWVIHHHPILLKQIDCEVYDIWKEIRGIIKGMIPKEWISYRLPLKEIKLSQETIALIIRKELAHIEADQLILHAEKLYEAKKGYLDPYTMQAVLQMHHYLDDYLIHHSMLSKEIYLNLDEQYCSYPEQKREFLYEIAISYQHFLDDQMKMDENDLARLFLQKLKQERVNLFDFVIADEIQDLTEVQIYCLIRLTRNRNHVLFSGDINQTIRPTYFHPGRIESILKTSNTHLAFEKYGLTKNYRSARETVELANKVIDLRVERLGLNKKNDYYEVAIRTRQSAIYFCEFTNRKDIITLIKTGMNRHYVAIVVPDQQEKKALEQLVTLKGAIFTVEEIKGIEQDYIICYNVMSKYRLIWETILNQDVLGQQQYRYYFNMLYVAITRARQQLCFVEEDMSPSLFLQLEDHFLVMNQYDEADFKLTLTSTDNEFYKEAQTYESRELYEQAINAYKLSNLEGVQRDIQRCQALIQNQEGDYLEAGHALMKLKEYEQAAHCFRQGHDQLHYLKALVYQGLPYEHIQQLFQEKGIDVLQLVYSQKTTLNWLHRFNKLYALSLNNRIKVIDKISKNIEMMK